MPRLPIGTPVRMVGWMSSMIFDLPPSAVGCIHRHLPVRVHGGADHDGHHWYEVAFDPEATCTICCSDRDIEPLD